MLASRAERRDLFSLRYLFALFLLLPVTVVFGHRGIAPWLLFASAPVFLRGRFWIAAFGALFDRLNPREPFFAAFLALIAFCAWIFLSGFWSPYEKPSLALWVLAPALVAGSLVWFAATMPRLWAFRLGLAFAGAVTVGMSVLAFEGASGGLLRDLLPPDDPTPHRTKDQIALGRGVTALAPALFPAGLIAAATRDRRVGLGVLLVGAAAALLNGVVANVAALALGLAVAIVAFRAPRLTTILVVTAAIFSLLAAPLAVLIPAETIFSIAEGAQPSMLHRLLIWRAAGEEIAAAPLLGHGAEYARVWGKLAGDAMVPGASKPMPLMPVHPHNVFVQIWLELGAVGAAFFALFLYSGARAFLDANLKTPVVAAALGAFTAILVSVLTEGSLWQVWRFAAMGLAAMGVGLAHALHQTWSR